ncbi:glycosyltransferase [Aurantibacter sp.]|uniref:glycosyltransferase n=1 Tax=Aurantibacter sp. TaxID=2807103 RepID=UPI0032654EDA
MKLSFVIPCYNMEKYLPECLDSLLDQNLNTDEFEVIVVNDESKDNTLNIANDYANKHPCIKVLDKKNGGVGAARNSGLDQAIGKYIFFLDPDDFLAQNVVGKLLAVIEANDLDILTFHSHDFKFDGPKTSRNLNDIDANELNITDGITYIAERKFKNEIWWFLTNREFLIESGIRFIEGRWMEDAILAAELFCKAKKMAHFDLDVHRYRILPNSAMRNKSREHYNKVIFDNANAAHVYNDLIKTIPTSHEESKQCINRLRTRQQSFVFFLMVRLMKSDISIDKIPEMLVDFEKINAYPLDNFIGEDYHGLEYSFMVWIFNHKSAIKPFIKVFRPLYRIIK